MASKADKVGQGIEKGAKAAGSFAWKASKWVGISGSIEGGKEHRVGSDHFGGDVHYDRRAAGSNHDFERVATVRLADGASGGGRSAGSGLPTDVRMRGLKGFYEGLYAPGDRSVRLILPSSRVGRPWSAPHERQRPTPKLDRWLPRQQRDL